jgi:hypothetical protein
MFKFLNKKPLWIQILFWLITYPITLPLLFWEYSKNKKWRKIGRTAFVIILIPTYFVLLAFYSVALSGSKAPVTEVSNNANNLQSNKETTKSTLVEVESQKEENKNFKDNVENEAKIQNDKLELEKAEAEKKAEELRLANRGTKEKIADLAKEVFKDSEGYISTGETTASLNVDINKKTAYDQKHYLEMMLNDFVKFGEKAVMIDGVNEIEVLYVGEVTDKYGKSTNETVYSIDMSKESFSKFTWENLQGSDGRMYKSIQDDAAIYILPSSSAKIDYSKVKFYYNK